MTTFNLLNPVTKKQASKAVPAVDIDPADSRDMSTWTPERLRVTPSKASKATGQHHNLMAICRELPVKGYATYGDDGNSGINANNILKTNQDWHHTLNSTGTKDDKGFPLNALFAVIDETVNSDDFVSSGYAGNDRLIACVELVMDAFNNSNDKPANKKASKKANKKASKKANKGRIVAGSSEDELLALFSGKAAAESKPASKKANKKASTDDTVMGWIAFYFTDERIATAKANYENAKLLADDVQALHKLLMRATNNRPNKQAIDAYEAKILELATGKGLTHEMEYIGYDENNNRVPMTRIVKDFSKTYFPGRKCDYQAYHYALTGELLPNPYFGDIPDESAMVVKVGKLQGYALKAAKKQGVTIAIDGTVHKPE